MHGAFKIVQSNLSNSSPHRYQALLILQSALTIQATGLYEALSVVLAAHQEDYIGRQVVAILQEDYVATSDVSPAAGREVLLQDIRIFLM